MASSTGSGSAEARIGSEKWSDRTLRELQRILGSRQSREKQDEKTNRLLDKESTWLKRLSVFEIEQLNEERWRDSLVPVLQTRTPDMAVVVIVFVGECGLVVLTTLTLL